MGTSIHDAAESNILNNNPTRPARISTMDMCPARLRIPCASAHTRFSNGVNGVSATKESPK